jgi:hypothetical protein
MCARSLRMRSFLMASLDALESGLLTNRMAAWFSTAMAAAIEDEAKGLPALVRAGGVALPASVTTLSTVTGHLLNTEYALATGNLKRDAA